MDPLVLSLVIFVALIIAVVMFRDPGRVVEERLLARHATHFDPASNSNVKRKLMIIAQPQLINENKYALEVVALPLPTDLPREAQNVKRLIAPIMHAQVRTRDGRRALDRFEPPLLVRVEPLAADGRAALVLLEKKGSTWSAQALPADGDTQKGEPHQPSATIAALPPDTIIALAEV